MRPFEPEAIAAIKAAVLEGLTGLRADPPEALADWAREHFILAGESSQQRGAWQAWSFQIGILDFMSDDRIEELVVGKSKRVGYSKMITAFVAYNIAHRRRNVALWQPTDDDRDSYVKSEIDPVLNGVEAVKKCRRGKDRETIALKRFRYSSLHVLGGKAARAYRRITVAVAILDEWSAFDISIEKSGDPGGLAKGRLEGAPFPKFIGGSTPRLKGICHVERALSNTIGFVRYNIACPHCGIEHPLTFGQGKKSGLMWEPGQPETVRHVCPHCLESIQQSDYLVAGEPPKGDWVCERTSKRYTSDRQWLDEDGIPCEPPRTLGVHVWAAYSPQRSWESIAEEHEQAEKALQAGNEGPMQLFVNETRGETWELVGEGGDESELKRRAEPYSLKTVPAGAIVLTAAVDVQRTWWEITVWGWGPGMESWAVDTVRIDGNPTVEGDWDAVTEYLQQVYPHELGQSIRISAISADSGDQTQSVYAWAMRDTHKLPKLMVVKGSRYHEKPILNSAVSVDVNYRGQKVPSGIKRWEVGVHAAKDLLLGQLSVEEPGPGYIHFSEDLEDEFYAQLTAEKRVLAKVNGRDVFKWIKTRQRNEQLDLRNYALHAALALKLNRMPADRWESIRRALTKDKPAAAPTPIHQPTHAVRPARRIRSRGVAQ